MSFSALKYICRLLYCSEIYSVDSLDQGASCGRVLCCCSSLEIVSHRYLWDCSKLGHSFWIPSPGRLPPLFLYNQVHVLYMTIWEEFVLNLQRAKFYKCAKSTLSNKNMKGTRLSWLLALSTWGLFSKAFERRLCFWEEYHHDLREGIEFYRRWIVLHRGKSMSA